MSKQVCDAHDVHDGDKSTQKMHKRMRLLEIMKVESACTSTDESTSISYLILHHNEENQRSAAADTLSTVHHQLPCRVAALRANSHDLERKLDEIGSRGRPRREVQMVHRARVASHTNVKLAILPSSVRIVASESDVVLDITSGPVERFGSANSVGIIPASTCRAPADLHDALNGVLPYSAPEHTVFLLCWVTASGKSQLVWECGIANVRDGPPYVLVVRGKL